MLGNSLCADYKHTTRIILHIIAVPTDITKIHMFTLALSSTCLENLMRLSRALGSTARPTRPVVVFWYTYPLEEEEGTGTAVARPRARKVEVSARLPILCIILLFILYLCYCKYNCCQARQGSTVQY
jgi:hypothetical protein